MLQPLNNQIAIPLSKWLVCAINGQTVLMRSPIYPKSGLILCTGKITSSVDSLLRDESISFPFPGYLLRAHHLLSSLKSQHLYSQQSLFLRKTSRMFLEILTEEKIWILFFFWEYWGTIILPGGMNGEQVIPEKQNILTPLMALPQPNGGKSTGITGADNKQVWEIRMKEYLKKKDEKHKMVLTIRSVEEFVAVLGGGCFKLCPDEWSWDHLWPESRCLCPPELQQHLEVPGSPTGKGTAEPRTRKIKFRESGQGQEKWIGWDCQTAANPRTWKSSSGDGSLHHTAFTEQPHKERINDNFS